MTNKEQIPIERKMTQKDLNKKIKDIEKEIKILERLKFINYRYQGLTVNEACEKLNVTKRVGYIWQERWNEEGYNGLIPKYGKGKPSKLTENQRKELKEYLIKNSITDTHEVQQIIKEEYNLEFTKKHVRTILHQLGLK